MPLKRSMITCLAPLILAGLCCTKAARADVLYDSFETPAEMIIPTAYGASLFRSPIHSTDGDWSAQVTYAAGERGYLRFRNKESWWTASELAFDATTDEDQPVPLFVRVRSGDRAFTARVVLKPGRIARIAVPCDALARGKVDFHDFGDYTIAGEGPPVLLTAVSGFDIGSDDPVHEHVVYIDNVRLIREPDATGPTLVDAYGQYAAYPWSGRVSSDAELQVDAIQEPIRLASWRRPRDQDRFGGIRGGKLREAPFFTVQKVGALANPPKGDRWRLVDPEGDPFFAIGVDEVSIASAGAPPGPAGLYASLPPGKPNFFASNLERKYGADYQKQWVKLVAARLHAWGFNTLGPGSAPAVAPEMARVIDLGSSAQMTGIHHLGPFPDVFDPGFRAAAEKALASAALYRESGSVIGYTFDHALPWDRLEDPAFVTAAGGPSAKALRALAAKNHGGGPDAADMQEFLADFAARYFKGIRQALQSSDHGHHLYLGCRFTSCPPAVAEACARDADVMTYDDYGPAPRVSLPVGVDRPILITAFSFGAADRGLMSGGPQPTASQTVRAAAYASYVKACAARPDIVGCLWNRYVDEPVVVANRAGANIGLVSITDRPYPELINACAKANTAAAGRP